MESKFIVTDPCYIVDDSIWANVCMELDVMPTPYKIIGKDGKEFIIHKCQETESGDGSYKYKDRDIGVDSGLICIAESIDGDWSNEKFGATFSNLPLAEKIFAEVLRAFKWD